MHFDLINAGNDVSSGPLGQL